MQAAAIPAVGGRPGEVREAVAQRHRRHVPRLESAQARRVGDEAPAGQLYNMSDDPTEQRNLYADRPDVVRRLQAMLDASRARS